MYRSLNDWSQYNFQLSKVLFRLVVRRSLSLSPLRKSIDIYFRWQWAKISLHSGQAWIQTLTENRVKVSTNIITQIESVTHSHSYILEPAVCISWFPQCVMVSCECTWSRLSQSNCCSIMIISLRTVKIHVKGDVTRKQSNFLWYCWR